MDKVEGITLRELLKRLYIPGITIYWDVDDLYENPIVTINNITENDWVMSEDLLDSDVFGIEVQNDELRILLRS